jgi:hypothetical protein
MPAQIPATTLDTSSDCLYRSNAEPFDKVGNIYPETIVSGILGAIQFTWPEDDDDSEGEYDRAQNAELSPAAEAFIRSYVGRFVEMLEAIDSPDELVIDRNSDRWGTSDCLGNDLWYTTQGYGVGFWEGEYRWLGHWKECDEFCKANRIPEAYLGDDGFIHLP